MMNVPEALHCIGCGAELGLMPLPADGRLTGGCPCCPSVSLDAFANDGGVVYDCHSCGGQFVFHDVLSTMLSRQQKIAAAIPRRLRRENPLREAVVYRPCPVCRELMLRRNFGKVSGIIVDVCSIHGTWFDCGELARILSFVTHGGLELAQERRADEARRAANHSAQLGPAPTIDWSGNGDAGSIGLREMEEAAIAFVGWLSSLLKRTL
ncbi:MAG: hypothetical protein QM784_25975 [Polyangiaceae bacterium]